MFDVIFTYVDGTDPEFQKLKRAYQTESDAVLNPPIRFVGLNEILYSVRSVLKHIRWIRNIFIVTFGQTPPIDQSLLDSGRVLVVDHSEIIPAEYMPTFFSDCIESFLYRIPGLSEIFLYNNDDCFHGADVEIDDVITAGGQIRVRSGFDLARIRTKTSEYSKRILNTVAVLSERFSDEFDNGQFWSNHHTKVLRKSTLARLELDFPEQLRQLRQSRFRNRDCIQYMFLAMNMERVYHRPVLKHETAGTAERDFLEYHFGDMEWPSGRERFLEPPRMKFVCYNNLGPAYANDYVAMMELLLSE